MPTALRGHGELQRQPTNLELIWIFHAHSVPWAWHTLPFSLPLKISRLDAFHVAAKSVRTWLVFPDEVHIRFGGDFVLHADGPIASIDQQPPQGFILQIG